MPDMLPRLLDLPDNSLYQELGVYYKGDAHVILNRVSPRLSTTSRALSVANDTAHPFPPVF